MTGIEKKREGNEEIREIVRKIKKGKKKVRRKKIEEN